MFVRLNLPSFDMLLHCDYDPTTCTVQELLDAVRKEVAVVFPPKYNRFANSFLISSPAGTQRVITAISGLKYFLRMHSPYLKEKVSSIPEVGQKWLTEVLAVGGSRPR